MAFKRGEMRERGGKWYKERGKWIIESRIEFPDPMFMTLDTPHGPNAKFLKTMTGKCGKNYFSPTLGFDSKTKSQLRSACKKSEKNL